MGLRPATLIPGMRLGCCTRWWGGAAVRQRHVSWGVHGRFNAQEAVSGANAPWTLMDRVITEDKVALRVDQVRKLVVRAAVGKSGMEEEQFRAELEVLLKLLPDLENRLERIHPNLLYQLVDDVDNVGLGLLRLRDLFPTANISVMAARCPSLLLKGNEEKILLCRSLLQQHLSEDRMDMVVTSEPSILMCNMSSIIEDLKRLMPSKDVWELIAQQPSIIFSAQKGIKDLGPGAEF